MHNGPRGRKMEKSKDFKGAIKKLFSHLRPWHMFLIISLTLAMISAILSLIAPNRLSDITNEITKGLTPNISEEKINEIMTDENISQSDKMTFVTLMQQISNTNGENQTEFLTKLDELPESIYEKIKPTMDLDKIKSIAFVLASIYIISALFGYVQSIIMANVSNEFAKKLRSNISSKINKLPLSYFDKNETGDILSRITNDVDTIAQSMNQSLSTLVTSTTLFIGSIIMMFYTNWIMAITAIVSSLFGFMFMGKVLSKSQKYFSKKQEELGKLNAHIEEIYSGHNVVKAYNGEKQAKEEFKKLNDSLYDCNRKSQFLSGLMQPFMGFIGNFGYVAVCIVGAILTQNDVISFGVIVAFMIYVRLFTNPLSQIAQAVTSLQSTAAASERVFEFLEETEMTDESSFTRILTRDEAKGRIEFKNVKFGYDPEKTIIKDFSVNVKSGEKIAIVGPTGAGKTTLVNLLMKFYEINSGDILIDGISTKELTRENIHDLFVMVLQDTWLFDGSIRDNLKYNKKNVSDERIMDACEKVGIDHLIKTLPGGLDAPINDNESISQGQKQLLTIARGMIEDAPFLILDEATSNVDTRTEELVQKAMDKLTIGKTSFIIAHRLSTIRNADLILVMNEGNIVEQGTHDELLSKGGLYANLYNSQFEK